MKKSVYSKPTLVKGKASWYVYFRYDGKKKVYKYDINRIKDLKEREYQFNVLRELLEKKLKKGWNPFSEIVLDYEKPIIEALEDALEEKRIEVKPKTYSGYKGTVKFISEAIIDLNLTSLKINEVKRAHIRLIINKAKTNRNWSNKAYNKHLNYLSAVMDKMIESDIIEYNPVTKIKRLKVAESKANRTATKEEHTIIKNHLKQFHPDFCNFIKAEYYTGARPKELLEIQLHMINLKNREIILPPENSKVGMKYRSIIIDDGLLNVLLSMEIEKYPKDFYLFGSFRQRGKGNLGKHLDFIPGTTPITRDTATKRWKRIVKDGLGINVNMYSFKHKGADDKLLAGVKLDTLRNQLGHSSEKMTKVYVKELKGIYKEDIIKHSTNFDN